MGRGHVLDHGFEPVLGHKPPGPHLLGALAVAAKVDCQHGIALQSQSPGEVLPVVPVSAEHVEQDDGGAGAGLLGPVVCPRDGDTISRPQGNVLAAGLGPGSACDQRRQGQGRDERAKER